MTSAPSRKPTTNAVRFSPNKSRRGGLEVRFICVHWTGGTFSSGVSWCMADESDVSYAEIIGAKEGEWRQLVPHEFASWSVGVAKSFDPRVVFTQANKQSYSIALAGCPPTKPTTYQLRMIVERVAAAMKHYGWGPDETFRIKSHSEVAVFPKGHKRAGQLGRKPDPDGDGWLDMNWLRTEVAKALRNG